MTSNPVRPLSMNTFSSNLGANESIDNYHDPNDSLDDSRIDNIASHPTPEGLMLTLMPAGIMPRLSAWSIDLVIRLLAMFIISIVFSIFGVMGYGFALIAIFLINWLYPVFFEVYKEGMTPGKKRQGIYVCHDDGTPITLQSSMIRNLLRVADFLPFGFVSGAIFILFNRQSQRIGDIVAGSIVVYRQIDDIEKLYESIYGFMSQQPDYKPNFEHQNSLGSNHQNNNTLTFDPTSALFFYPLTLTEQQAFVSYTERMPFLSKERQVEIANHLAPLVHVNNATPTMQQQGVYQAVIERSNMIVGRSMSSALDITSNQYNETLDHPSDKRGVHQEVWR